MAEDHAALLARFRAIFASPAFETLGGEVLALSVVEGTSEIAFLPRPEFCNPFGHVQGGFVTAMLDAASGIAAIAKSDFTCFVPTLDIRVSFLKPVPCARLIGRGQCLHLGRTIAFLEGSLHDEGGTLLARTSVTSRVVRRDGTATDTRD
ncbi:MAG: PaaI family thioesterase [Rhodothalassiaceae bacterium]